MRRRIVLASLAYVLSVLALTWLKLAVLCRGDIKFDGGCGGFELYAPLNILFTAPLFVLAIAAGHLGGGVRPGPPRCWRSSPRSAP